MEQLVRRKDGPGIVAPTNCKVRLRQDHGAFAHYLIARAMIHLSEG
jgi:hypothetical protein